MDYSHPRRVTFTEHARDALRDRRIAASDVLWILSGHDSDEQGDKPWKRELVGETGRGRIRVVIAVLEDEVRVLTTHPVPPNYRRR